MHVVHLKAKNIWCDIHIQYQALEGNMLEISCKPDSDKGHGEYWELRGIRLGMRSGKRCERTRGVAIEWPSRDYSSEEGTQCSDNNVCRSSLEIFITLTWGSQDFQDGNTRVPFNIMSRPKNIPALNMPWLIGLH